MHMLVLAARQVEKAQIWCISDLFLSPLLGMLLLIYDQYIERDCQWNKSPNAGWVIDELFFLVPMQLG